jgi:gamma-glutamyltranspeptidase/glutathione hydrolase
MHESSSRHLMRRAPVYGTFGVASGTHWLPVQMAMAILERGGNAFDAAVAGGFAFQVADPCMNGLGGEAVAILSRRGRASCSSIVCGQGVAPKTATVAKFSELGLRLVPDVGAISAVVPGAFDALLVILLQYGTLHLSQVLTPAVYYAEKGCPISEEAVRRINKFASRISKWPATAAIYLPNGQPLEPAQMFTNHALAKCLNRLLREAASVGTNRDAQIVKARDAFYKGFVAEEIERFVHPVDQFGNDECRDYCGFLSADDLSNWHATVEAPAKLQIAGGEVHKAGPWSQGPVLLQSLALAQELDMRAAWNSSERVHLVTEIFKLAYADREAYYGDSGTQLAPLEALLSSPYNRLRAALVAPSASVELLAGAPTNSATPCLPSYEKKYSRIASRDSHTVHEASLVKDTCHLNVIDNENNVASLTLSGGWFYDSPVIPNLGFSLSTRANMFWLQEGLASTLMPGRRPRTTLTPTIAFTDSGGVWTLGCRGADYSDQYLTQALISLLFDHSDLQAAVDRPAFVSRHWPDSVYPRQARTTELLVDPEYGDDVLGGLKERGHLAAFSRFNELGRVCGAGIQQERFVAASTSRSADYGVAGR